MGDAVAVGNGLGSSGDWSGPTDLAQDHDRGLGLGPKNQEDSVSIDPHGCALCALALVYCHQNALCVQHLAVEEDLRAGEMCEKCDEIIGSLPRGQAAALSLGLPLPTEAVDGLCDFLVQGVSKRSTPIHHQGSSFEDLKRGLRDALMSHPDEAEELCGALDFFLNSLETPDDLVMFFARAHDLAGGGAGQGGGVVEPNSMLGVYLRERCAAFELLSFEGVGRLLRRCESFRAGEVAESATAGGAGGKGAGARSEPALLDRFLRDAKRRDYYSALSSLHAYFDCSAGRHPGLRGGDHRLGNFEHATLEMAQVHVQFGQYGEAAKALEETLRSSQQNTNHVCLAHSLALMCRVLSSPEYRFESCTRPKRGRDAGHNHCVGDANARRLRDLLRHCLRRSRDLRLPHLECFALVEMARIALEEGDATKTVDAVADLVGRIAHVVGNESAETDAGDAALEDLGLEPCPRLSLYPAAAGGSEMLRAGAGSARGLVEELAASLELLRVARWQDKGCRDYAASLARKVLQAGYGGSEATRDAAVAILVAHDLEERGPEAAGRSLLELCPSPATAHAGMKTKRQRRTELGVEFWRAEHVGDHASCLRAASAYALLASSTDAFDVATYAEAKLLEGEALLRCGDLEGAIGCSDEGFEVCYRSGLGRTALEFLLLSARCRLACGDHAGAARYVLSARHQSESCGWEPLHLEATLVLARTYKCQGGRMVRRAVDLLRREMPGFAAKCGAVTRGRARLLLARCIIHQGGEGAAAESLTELDSAADLFAQVGHRVMLRECAYVEALACDHYGLKERRDEAARRFRELDVGLGGKG